MKPEAYKQQFDIEDFHWWFVANRNICLDVIDASFENRQNLKILDAGCGTGGMLAYLAKRGYVFGLDLSEKALFFARKKVKVPLVRASVQSLTFQDNTFDLIVSNDVLYHLDVLDDYVTLKEHKRVLKRGGKLFIRVAAFNWLYSQHDQNVHTARRYTKRELMNKVKKAGFEVELCSYTNFFFFPIVVLKRISESLIGSRYKNLDLKVVPPFINKALTRVLSMEVSIFRKVNLPFGSSIICLAKKQ